jgi:rod shape-determining protein MreD
MSAFAWIGLAWIGTCLVTALEAHGGFGYVLPDPVIIVVVYLALRREALQVVLIALALGYLVGRQDLGPTGLHPLALGVIALGAQLLAGSLAASGPVFQALITAAATAAYHALLFALLYGLRGSVGFASWSTAILVPQALLTALLGIFATPLLNAVEKRLAPDSRASLSWR